MYSKSYLGTKSIYNDDHRRVRMFERGERKKLLSLAGEETLHSLRVVPPLIGFSNYADEGRREIFPLLKNSAEVNTRSRRKHTSRSRCFCNCLSRVLNLLLSADRSLYILKEGKSTRKHERNVNYEFTHYLLWLLHFSLYIYIFLFFFFIRC